MARVIRFSVPFATPLLNQQQGVHWSRLRNRRKAIAWQVKLAVLGQIPPQPFARARVTITRHSPGVPDTDNLWGGVKGLVDCLVAPGSPVVVKGKPRLPHPFGLGLVADDNPARMELVVRAEKCPRGQAKTEIVIEELI